MPMSGAGPATAALTTNLVGGLGNQLFLVANLLATARRNGLPAFLPRQPWSSSSEAPRPTYWTSVFARLEEYGVSSSPPPSVRAEEEVLVPERRPVAPIVLDHTRPGVCYNMVGFFQSETFFRDHPVIQDVIPVTLRQRAERHLARCYCGGGGGDDDGIGLSRPSHTVGLHVRRGDYTRMRDVFEELDVFYYDAALRQLLGSFLLAPGAGPSAVGGPAPVTVLVFCEDDHVGDHFVGYLRTKYRGLAVQLVHPRNEESQNPVAVENVGEDGAGVPPREVLELLMLSRCNDVVMANSTFSWWAAYLNRNPLHRVVAPSRWFVKDPYPSMAHLYCKDWMLL